MPIRPQIAFAIAIALCSTPGLSAASDRSGVRPEVLNVPAGPGAIEGLGEGFDASAQSGSGGTSVGIRVPPGPAGFAPSLSLNYATGAGNSALGMGWSLPLPMVSRGTDRGLPRYDDSDIFVLSGMGATGAEDLVQVADGSYRFRIEGAFVRGRQRDDGTWLFVNASGTRFVFGQTPESIVSDVDNPERVYSFCLTSKTDTHGNSIRYEYEQDQNKPYLSRIVYGENEVRFTYEERLDAITSYLSRFAVTTARRLAHIETFHRREGVLRYQLSYEMSQSMSRLSSVTLSGADGTQLPSTRYQYAGFDMMLAQVVDLGNAPARALEVTAELVDINGDALPDVLVTDPSQNGGRYSYYPNLDGTSFGARIVQSSSPSVWLTSPGVELADMDGDGAADVVAHISNSAGGTRFFPALASGAFGAPVTISPTSGLPIASPDLRRIDLNHDRLTDWMSIDPSTGAIRMGLNLGDGAFTSAQTMPPVDGTELVAFSGDGLRLADVNGDGLTDLVALRDNGARVWLSKGFGEFTAGMSMAGAPSLSTGEQARAHLADATGDGLADLLLVESGRAQVWENIAGRGYASPRTLTGLPELRPTTQVRMADMNGSGSADIVWIDPTHASPWRTLDLLADGNPGFLTRIDNGLGKTTTLRYRSMGFMRGEARAHDLAWDKRCPIGMMMLSEIDQSDGLGNVLSSKIRYADAYYDGRRREFRGFATSLRTEIGDSEQPALVSIKTYDVGDIDEARKGLPITAATATPEGSIFERVTHTHAVKTLDEGRLGLQTRVPLRFAFTTEKRKEIFEGGDTPVEILERFSYDDYGNVLRHEEWGVVDGENLLAGSDERVTVRQFAVNESAWILHGAFSQEVQDINGTRMSMSRSYFDNLPLGQVGTRGLLTKSESWIAGDYFGLDGETQYSSAGNPVVLLDARGGRTIIEFDETQTFAIAGERSIDGERSLRFGARYDTGLGVMTASSDANGVESLFQHDDLGRLTAVISPGDTEEFPTKRYEYSLGAPISHIRTATRETAGQPGEIVSIAYVDGMGRGRGSFQEASGGQFAVSGITQFGRRGHAVKAFHPFYAGSADFIADPGTRSAVATTYDAMGRALTTTQPDGSQSRVSYGPLSLVTYDENDNDAQSPHFDTPATTFSDGLGRTTILREQLGSESVDAMYRYDALGNVLSVVDQNGDEHSYAFDGRGRQISVSDPSAGTWSLVYNDAGDVVARTDATGNRVEYVYDLLGRVTTESHTAAGGESRNSVRYHYDGTRSRSAPESMQSYQLGRLSWIQDDAGEEHFGYDARGRTVDTIHRFSDGDEYHTFSDYDTADRVTYRGFPDGSRLGMEYNERGLLVSVPGLVDHVSYTAWGEVQEVRYGNGVIDSTEFDSRLRQTRKSAVAPDNRAIRDLRYEFDPASQILNIADGRSDVPAHQSLSQSFIYDDRYRLVAAQDSEAETTWAVDSVGNLLEVASGHSDAHLNATFNYGGTIAGQAFAPSQLASVGDRAFSYDSSGRVLSDGVRQMSWDARGRLAAVERGSIVERYTYRSSGTRAEKVTIDGDKTTVIRSVAGDVEVRNGKLIRYLSAFGKAVKLDRDEATPASAAAQVLASAGSTLAPAPERPWYAALTAALCLLAWLLSRATSGSTLGLRRRKRPWAMVNQAALTGSLLVFVSCGGGAQHSPYAHDGELLTEWPEDAELTLRDHLGSGVAVVDDKGADLFQRSYHPYGITRSEFVADLSPAGSAGQADNYVGNERDQGSALGHFHARPYDYQVARFLGPDPLRLFPVWEKDGATALLASYNYSAGNPIRFMDADGRLLFDVVKGSYETEVGDTRASIRADLGVAVSPGTRIVDAVLDVASPLAAGTDLERTTPSARLDLFEDAAKHLGDKSYAYDSKNGRFGAQTYKCNQFTGHRAQGQGVNAERIAPRNGKKRLLQAFEWGDPSRNVPGTTVIPGGDANALPGDILAIDRRHIYSDATGHATIAAGKINIRDSTGFLHKPRAGQVGIINPGQDGIEYRNLIDERKKLDPAEGFTVRRLD